MAEIAGAGPVTEEECCECLQDRMLSLECAPALLSLLECGNAEGHTLALGLLQSLDDAGLMIPSGATSEGDAGSDSDGMPSQLPERHPEQVLAK